MTPEAAFEKAIQIVGSRTALAKRLKITRQAVCKWAKVPLAQAYEVEQATGGVVRCHELRPDAFPEPRRKARA